MVPFLTFDVVVKNIQNSLRDALESVAGFLELHSVLLGGCS
jgi:hypothetical protein